jgi:hypothetical protein
MFTKKFDTYACDGDSITCEVDGFVVTATIEYDDSSGEPWNENDGHGPVSDWTTRDKNPGEIVLCSDDYHRGSKRYYNYQEAVKIAHKDWGFKAGKESADAAIRDFERLKAWCNNVWHYVGVCVHVSRKGIKLTDKYGNALWGIESDEGDHLTEVANDLLEEALNEARKKLAELVK